jgi:hypothetical protein
VSWPEALRQAVERRALGRCEYCLLHRTDAVLPHHIDHVISRKHQGPSELENLAFACYLCNLTKGSDIASLDRATGHLVRLFHPRLDAWSEHFQIVGAILEPLTNIGAATSQLLRLNIAKRVTERQLLQSLNRYPRTWTQGKRGPQP